MAKHAWAFRWKKLFRAVVPRRAVIAAGLLHVFLRLRGHARRNRHGMCVNAAGDPVPWLTGPALDFLESLDLAGARVFEFGMGASTVYWARRGCTVVGVEMDPAWQRRIESLKLPNVTPRLCADGGFYPRVIDEYSEAFDVILIDGAERFRSAQRAVSRLATGGMIVLDNSEWYPQTARRLRDQGFTQIDFCGFAPLNAFTSVTSIFFRQEIRFAYLPKAPSWLPIGGRGIPGGALDDRESGDVS
jgi:predicted O-methyltransferase YrrM